MSEVYIRRLRAVQSEFYSAREAIGYVRRNWQKHGIYAEMPRLKPINFDDAGSNLEVTYFTRLYAEFEGILKDHLATNHPNVTVAAKPKVDRLISQVVKAASSSPDWPSRELSTAKFAKTNLGDHHLADNEMKLRYGTNPHQVPARVFAESGELPLQVLNGAPGYINLLDALNSWQLVRDLRQALDLPAATSFKHVSPAGAAVSVPLSDALKRAYFVDDLALSPLATAYARARGADRLSSFGDWVALSDAVDLSTATLLSREVSDGVIAPGYEPEALALLQKKQKGKYAVLQIDPAYQPGEVERRQIFGLTFEQRRNDQPITKGLLENVVTQRTDLSDDAKRDMLVALIALKYTQSNSVCLALGGQTIGIGAGQQSRIHCTRLACAKADQWYLRQRPTVLNLPFKTGLKRPERENAIDQYLQEDLSPEEERALAQNFETAPAKLTREEKREWLDGLRGVTLGSDGFIPFRDSIDRASRSGVEYIVQPGGSLRDEDVIQACNAYGMVMVSAGIRLFHH